MNSYVISEQLEFFLIACNKLMALEQGGVDNWEFYDEAIKQFEENYGLIDEIYLENYMQKRLWKL